MPNYAVVKAGDSTTRKASERVEELKATIAGLGADVIARAEVSKFLAAGGGAADSVVAKIQELGLGNIYVKLVNSDVDDTVVTLNGESVTIPAGETYDGFVNSFEGITLPHYLKEVVVVGDTEVSFGDTNSTENNTMTKASLYFTQDYSRSLDNLFLQNILLSEVNLYVGKPTSAARVFRYAKSMTSIDISDWDMSLVESMRGFCYMCSELVELKLSKSDTPKLTDLRYMCYDCEKLKSVDLGGINTSEVTDMGWMFAYCYVLNNLDASLLKTGKVELFECMFLYCYALEVIDVSGFDTSSATTLYAMFYYCTSVKYLDVSKWNTSNVTDMGYVFIHCESVEEINGVGNWETDKVTYMRSIFSSCFSLKSLDLWNWRTQNVENSFYLFNANRANESINLGEGFDMSACDGVDDDGTRYEASTWFYQNYALTTITGTAKGIRLNLTLEDAPLLTRESALVLINGLSEDAISSTPTITFNSATLALLTEEDIAIAEAKGWTVA